MSKFQIYKGKDQGDQCWRWRLKDDNHEIIAHSEEPFHKGNVEESVQKIQKNAPCAPIIAEDSQSVDGYFFEYYKDNAEQWRWRLKAGNHEIMAIGESYVSESGVKNALDNIKQEMGRASIEWE